jgi:hypothetical protein
MGLSTSKKKIHLTHQEILNFSSKNSSLQFLYNKNKNASGALLLKDLDNIFENKLDPKIVKKLFKICSTEKNKFNFEDFKYLYSLFKTDNYDAKINFITDLIFVNKNSITLEKYRKKVNFMFGEYQTLNEKLLSNEFLNNMTSNNKITKENFLKNLDTIHKEYFNKFKFLKQINEDEVTDREDDDNQIEDEKLILSSNNLLCECVKIKSGVGLKHSETTKFESTVSKQIKFLKIVFNKYVFLLILFFHFLEI